MYDGRAEFRYLFSGVAQGGGGGLADAAGKIWALPDTAAGLIYGGIGYAAGWINYADGGQAAPPTVTLGFNAIEFLRDPLNVSAITLGNTINYGLSMGPYSPSPESPFHTVGMHELQHTYQSEILGPLFMPTAALSLGLGSAIDGNSHGPASFMERGPQQDPPQPW
jgi:hypothetical protein